ncbi:MAG: type II CAAX endopeptidase family protein [Marinoscillum sp.]
MINYFGTMNERYPNILQSFGLFVIYTGVTFLLSFFTVSIPGSLGTFITTLSTSGIALMLALMLKQAHLSYLFGDNRQTSLITYLLAGLFAISMVITLDPVVSLIPMPDWFKEMILSIVKKDVYTYLTLALVAPIGEELLFRKVMLTGLVKNYGVTRGILWSAFFFALFHLNPWQGISAFVIGIFLGWIYLKTGNIWLCIFVHFFNNTISFIGFYFSDDPFATTLDYFSMTEYVILILISIACMYFCVRTLQRHFAKTRYDAEKT